MISLLMEQMISMTDTAFMGRVGEIELGASALASIFYMVVFMLGFGFTVGAQIIIARRNGEQLYGRVGKILWQGIYILTGMALVMFVLTEVFSPAILKKIVSSPDVARSCEEYIGYRMFGLFFAFNAAMFRAYYVGTVRTGTLTLNSVVMVLSNVLFNWVLVFGKLGFPAMGIAGAAIGSTLAEAVSLTFFIVYTRFRTDYVKYGLAKVYRPDLKVISSIFGVSFWTMIQNFISFSTWFAFIVFVEHLGERSLAITNIVRNIGSVPMMIVVAFSSAASSVVSNLIGGGQSQDVRPTILRIVKMCYLVVVPITLLFSLFPEVFARIYTDMPSLYEAVAPSVRVFSSAMLIIVPANILFHSVSGTGNTRMAFQLELGALVIYVAYSAFVTLGLGLDVSLCWSAEHVYYTILLIFCGYYIRSGKWIGRYL